MPVPMEWKNQCFVDFKGELQLQSDFQLDLYTYGLNEVPRVFLGKQETWGTPYKTGVLLVEKEAYHTTEAAIKEKFQDIGFSAAFVADMYRSLERLKEANLFYEKKIREGSLTGEDFKAYKDILLKVMSFMAMQWLSFDLPLLGRLSGRKTEELALMASTFCYEPYQIRYDKAFLQVLENPSEENRTDFMINYAFLENFEIDRNDGECQELFGKRVERERKRLKEYKEREEQKETLRRKNRKKRQELIEAVLAGCDGTSCEPVYNNLLLLRACTDEEEERHYQQARAVRNMRWLLEGKKQSIYLGISGIEELLGA